MACREEDETLHEDASRRQALSWEASRMRPQFKSVAQDGHWFNLRIWRQNCLCRVWANNVLLAEESGEMKGPPTIALAQGPGISFKNIRLQDLPAKANGLAAGGGKSRTIQNSTT